MTSINHAETAETLHRAADLIEERGWATGGESMAVPGPHCLMGAVGAASGSRIADDVCAFPIYCYYGVEQEGATRVIREYLGLAAYTPGAGSTDLWRWNDTRGTAAEVIEVLRAAAAIEQSKADAELTTAAELVRSVAATEVGRG